MARYSVYLNFFSINKPQESEIEVKNLINPRNSGGMFCWPYSPCFPGPKAPETSFSPFFSPSVLLSSSPSLSNFLSFLYGSPQSANSWLCPWLKVPLLAQQSDSVSNSPTTVRSYQKENGSWHKVRNSHSPKWPTTVDSGCSTGN